MRLPLGERTGHLELAAVHRALRAISEAQAVADDVDLDVDIAAVCKRLRADGNGPIDASSDRLSLAFENRAPLSGSACWLISKGSRIETSARKSDTHDYCRGRCGESSGQSEFDVRRLTVPSHSVPS